MPIMTPYRPTPDANIITFSRWNPPVTLTLDGMKSDLANWLRLMAHRHNAGLPIPGPTKHEA